MLIAVALLALLLRLLVVLVLDYPLESDYFAYHTMAVNLITQGELRDNFGNYAYYNPGYALLWVAPIYALFGMDPQNVQIGNAVLGAVSTTLVAALAWKVVRDERATILSAVVWAVYVESWVYAEYLAKENLVIPLLLGQLMIAVGLLRGQASAPRSVLAGILGGVAVLTSTAALAVFCAIIVAVLLAPALDLRTRLVHAGVIATCLSAVVGGLVLRNHHAVELPVVSTSSGFNLYLGNNPNATGFFVSIADTPKGSEWRSLRQMGEAQADRALRDEAVAFIAQNPAHFARLSAKKVVAFWTPPTHRGQGPEGKVEALARMVWLAQYVLLAGFALISLASIRTNPAVRLLWTSVIFYTLIHALAYVIFRYRLPIMAVMVPLAVIGLWSAFDRLLRPGAKIDA